MIVPVVRGLFRRPSLSGSPTLCSPPQSCGQETRCRTNLLRRLRTHMTQHIVDFIGGDFNMSAFSTVGDVFAADPEFPALGNSLLWVLGALEESNRERTSFLIMPKRPYEWYVDAHGCYKFNSSDLELGPRDITSQLPVFLHLRSTNFPGPDSITRSDQARQKRLERKATKHERRQCRRRLTQPPASRCASPAFAGEHSGCSLRVVAALSGVPHCSDLCMLSIWNQ